MYFLWVHLPFNILDDFIISLEIAKKGYTIAYDPEAYAIETASANVKEELKRKVRIAAGGIQSIIRLRSLLNIFRYKTLSFQYISHRVPGKFRRVFLFSYRPKFNRALCKN